MGGVGGWYPGSGVWWHGADLVGVPVVWVRVRTTTVSPTVATTVSPTVATTVATTVTTLDPTGPLDHHWTPLDPLDVMAGSSGLSGVSGAQSPRRFLTLF